MANLKLSHTLSSDSDTLALLGKKQVLKRRFGFWSLFGFAVCELITWETVLALFSQSFTNGGPAGSVYGFLIAWTSTLSVYTVVSELASLAPISGGQYYWVYMLAPPDWKVFCSYIIGWLTSLAWVATIATETIFAGTILQGLVILDHPEDYAPERWHGTLLAWAVVAVAIFINVFTPGFLPKLEIGIIFLHLSAFVGIVTTLWVLTPEKQSTHFVFATSLNEGHWPTQGLSYCVGFLGNVATFVGADASVHLAEETADAARTIPRAIIASMCVNGAVGFVMMVTILFCLGDVESVLNTSTGFPFIQIFANSVGNIAGATAMGAIVLILTWMCSTGIITTASRMTWSFARDKGTPFSTILSTVSSKRRIPVAALCTACFLACLLTLIYIGSSTAFNDVVSLTITGFYSSYFLPAAFLLYRRMKGTIAPYRNTASVPPPSSAGAASDTVPIATSTTTATNLAGDVQHQHDHRLQHKGSADDLNDNSNHFAEDEADAGVVIHDDEDHRRQSILDTATLSWGPFHLPGMLGIINNIYACAYMIFVIFWSVWPPEYPATAENMNYSIVVTGGVVIFSMIWYWIRGKRDYHGPTIDQEVVEHVAKRRQSSAGAETRLGYLT